MKRFLQNCGLALLVVAAAFGALAWLTVHP